MSVPQAQLVLPSMDGHTFPEARVRLGGGIEIDATTIPEHLGEDVKIGDRVTVVVEAVVRSKQFVRGTRTEDGLEMARNVLVIGLRAETIDPA